MESEKEIEITDALDLLCQCNVLDVLPFLVYHVIQYMSFLSIQVGNLDYKSQTYSLGREKESCVLAMNPAKVLF